MKIVILSLILLGIAYGLIGGIDHSFQNRFQVPLSRQTAYYFDKQILDHFDSSEPQKYWRQRYWILDSYFNKTNGPLFLYICGESEGRGLTKGSGFTAKLAQKYQGIAISVEHRFYGKSQPFGQNDESYSTENLSYLSHDQALADLAVFIQFLKDNKIAGISQDTPVIAVGGSYPGALSAWFRYKYPHLTIGSYASSAVVNAIDNFEDYDKQVQISLGYYGSWCPQSVKNVYAYIEEQLSTPANNIKIKQKFGAQNLDDTTFLYMVSNFPLGNVQYGHARNFCNMLKGKSTEGQVNVFAYYLKGNAKYVTVDNYKYTEYFEQSSGRQWNYQKCTTFGWFKTSYQKKPLRPASVNLEFFHKRCQEIFGNDYITRADLTNNMMGGVDMRVDNVVFTNGLEDPWQWASIRQTEGQMDSYIADCHGCGHCGDLGTPRKSDPESLKQQRQHVENHIDKWLAEYRQQLHGDNVTNIDFGHQQWEYDTEDEIEEIYSDSISEDEEDF